MINFILKKNYLKKYFYALLNPLSANPTKWSNTLKQFVGNLPTNCLSAFDHFVKLALKGLKATPLILQQRLDQLSSLLTKTKGLLN